MPTNFPTSLDAFDAVPESQAAATVHRERHQNIEDAVEALEASVGVNGSSVPTSLRYLVEQINGPDGSNAIGYTQGGAGAVPRTVQDKIRELGFSANDFGAVGDNSTDDTAFLNLAIVRGIAASVPVSLPSRAYLTTASLAATGARLVGQRETVDTGLYNGYAIAAANLPDGPVLSFGAGERYVQSYRNSKHTANNIYNGIFPSINHFDALQGVTHIPSGSGIEHATGIAGYIRSDDAAVTNGVAVFGCAMATVNGAAVWGLNTLLQDSATRAVGALTGVFLVNELDFNVMCPATTVIGCSLGGNSLSQPVSANGFVINPLGTGIKWETGFITQDGAATNALNIGMASMSGANVDSQLLLMAYTTGGGVKQNIRARVTGGGFFELDGSIAPQGYLLKRAGLFLDATHTVTIGGQGVLGDRRTGYTNAMTGTANRATSYATGTITLAQLAERVKAIQDDLTSHGIIGV